MWFITTRWRIQGGHPRRVTPPRTKICEVVFLKIRQICMLAPPPGVGAPSYGESCIRPWGVLVLLKFWQFSNELTKTWSSGTTECRVWIGNCNVKVWKSTEHKLHKIWCSLKFLHKFRKTSTPLLLVNYGKSHWWSLSPLTNLTNSNSLDIGKTRMFVHVSNAYIARLSLS